MSHPPREMESPLGSSDNGADFVICLRSSLRHWWDLGPEFTFRRYDCWDTIFHSDWWEPRLLQLCKMKRKRYILNSSRTQFYFILCQSAFISLCETIKPIACHNLNLFFIINTLRGITELFLVFHVTPTLILPSVKWAWGLYDPGIKDVMRWKYQSPVAWGLFSNSES